MTIDGSESTTDSKIWRQDILVLLGKIRFHGSAFFRTFSGGKLACMS